MQVGDHPWRELHIHGRRIDRCARGTIGHHERDEGANEDNQATERKESDKGWLGSRWVDRRTLGQAALNEKSRDRDWKDAQKTR